MIDEDGVAHVMEGDDGIIALDGSWTRIYARVDKDGIGHVKMEGEGVNRGRG